MAEVLIMLADSRFLSFKICDLRHGSDFKHETEFIIMERIYKSIKSLS